MVRAVDPHGHAVRRDQFLGGDLQGHGAQADALDPVDGRQDQDQPRALGPVETAEPEVDGPLVLADHPQRRQQQNNCGEHHRENDPERWTHDATLPLAGDSVPGSLGPICRPRSATH